MKIEDARDLNVGELLAMIRQTQAWIAGCERAITLYKSNLIALYEALHCRQEQNGEFGLPPVNGPEDYVP